MGALPTDLRRPTSHNASAAIAQPLDAHAADDGLLCRDLKSVTGVSAIRLTFSADTAVAADDAEAGDGNGALAGAPVYTCERDDHAPRPGDTPSEGPHSPR